MAEYSTCILTEKGRSLMAKAVAGTASIEFTKFAASADSYTEAQAASLSVLGNIKQTELITSVKTLNSTSVALRTVFTNKSLKSEYYIRTVGVYAKDPDAGEILYAVFRAITPAQMPPYNSKYEQYTSMAVIITVGSSETVTVSIADQAVATHADIVDLSSRLKVYFTMESDGLYVNYDE